MIDSKITILPNAIGSILLEPFAAVALFFLEILPSLLFIDSVVSGVMELEEDRETEMAAI